MYFVLNLLHLKVLAEVLTCFSVIFLVQMFVDWTGFLASEVSYNGARKKSERQREREREKERASERERETELAPKLLHDGLYKRYDTL